jgi:hypothetical protein
VNFFGHAAVASWFGDADLAPRAFGAMLPDFAGMIRARLDSSHDRDVAAGVDLHHATDAAFHRAPPVVALMRELDDRLARAGCARGPRRATAHVGIELALDGVLVDDAAYRAAYLAGLACDPSAACWRDADASPRLAILVDRLRAHGAPVDLQRADAIARRLARMLVHRPLLAPSAADLAAIERALADQLPRVAIAADAIMRVLRAALTPVASADGARRP